MEEIYLWALMIIISLSVIDLDITHHFLCHQVMKNHGYVRVAAAVPNVKVADCVYNADHILRMIQSAESQGVQIVCFPELSITAYTCADLFYQSTLLQSAQRELSRILGETAHSSIIFLVGLPLVQNGRMFNVAAVCQAGKILGVVPKMYLPNYNEFYEKRWFTSGKDITSNTVTLCGQTVPFASELLFGDDEVKFAVEICEDVWVPLAPSNFHTLNGAQIIFNLSTSNDLSGKNAYLQQMLQQQASKCVTGYVYASSGFGESTTDLVFGGNGYIIENGRFLAKSERFSFEEQLIISEIDVESLNLDRLKNSGFYRGKTDLTKEYTTIEAPLREIELTKLYRPVSSHPFMVAEEQMDERCKEIFSIQVGGLATRLYHTGMKTAVVGISGGLDSTLALLVTVKTFDKLNIPRSNIYGITMPGFGTTGRTYNNAINMMKSLGVTIKEISIKDACIQHFKDIEHDPANLNVVYENSQARERTQILMDYSNKVNGLVIGTGDLSELALGWCTYNGDQMSMYAVNTDVPKTLVRILVKYVALNEVDDATKATLMDVIDTPVSPELLPADKDGNIAQITEDFVGPYELHDFFIFYMLRYGYSPKKIFFMIMQAQNKYDKATVLKWLKTFYRRFFIQQFKRSCMPDGPKVGSIALSPRGDLRMPSDASFNIWMKEIEELGA